MRDQFCEFGYCAGNVSSLAPPARKHSRCIRVCSSRIMGCWSTDSTDRAGVIPIADSRISIGLWQSGQARPRSDTREGTRPRACWCGRLECSSAIATRGQHVCHDRPTLGAPGSCLSRPARAGPYGPRFRLAPASGHHFSPADRSNPRWLGGVARRFVSG